MLIVRKILVLFLIALIKFIHSFDVDIDIEQSKPFFLRRNTLCFADFGNCKNYRQNSYLQHVYLISLQKTLYLRKLLFSCNFA